MNRIVQKSCRYCGRFSAQLSDGRCPHCGRKDRRSLWEPVSLGLMMIFLLVALVRLIYWA